MPNYFLINPPTPPTFKILSSQLLFNSPHRKSKLDIFPTLHSIINDKENSIDLRMDAVDTLLQYGDADQKQFAQTKIREFGYGNIIQSSVYQHSQNVHHKSIDKSVLSILEKLKNHNAKVIKRPTFENIVKKISSNLKKYSVKDRESIRISLNRIVMDRCLYGKLNMTLQNILVEVWIYIQKHKYKNELYKRLLEELIEMSGKCSSGYTARLVNTLSGFGDFSVQISFEDQIGANVMARLNKRVMDIKDEKMRITVINEMTETDIEKKKFFLKFFRENISYIREELYTKFKDDMTSTDFDLYMKKAIMKYEGY